MMSWFVAYKKMSQLILLQKDNTYTKLFVGGLPYHTTDQTLREFFTQFGELDEAVVIIDKTTKKSKGYGFVTMADKEGAERACTNPNPYIDGRRANVNLAYLGAKPKHGSQPGSPAGHAAAGYQSAHGSPPPSPPIPLPLSPPAGYPGPSMMPTAPQPAAIYYELPYGPNASLYPATFYPFNPQLPYASQYGYIPPHFLPPSPQMVQYS